jgi:phage terminase large subunit-like protein
MPWKGPDEQFSFPTLFGEIADGLEKYLTVPGGPLAGQPLQLAPWQWEFGCCLYRIDPDTGRYAYRRGAASMPKGMGKSPFLGALAFAELVLPTVFDGWDADGNPVGRPRNSPWVQIAAVSEDQTDNCYIQLVDMLRDSDAVADYGMDVGLTRTFLKGRSGRIEPVTASSGSREGQPVTFAVLEETQYWRPSNGGVELAATIRRNIAKTDGRSVEITNAYRKGDDSVAEATSAAALKKSVGLYYSQRRGPWVDDLLDAAAVRSALDVAYAGCSWVDLDRLTEECADPSTTADDARRFYLGWPSEAPEDAWISPGQWEQCRTPGGRLDFDLPVFVGIDVALKHDTTAIVIVQDQGARIFAEARIWTPTPTQVLDLKAVEAYLRVLAGRYTINEIVYDPRFFERSAQELESEGLPLVEFPQNHSRMVPACGNAYEVIASGRLAHDGDQSFTDQMLAAAPVTTEHGWRLSKGRSRRKIDAAIALAMALDRVTRRPEAQVDVTAQIF